MSVRVQNVIFVENTSTTAIGGLAITTPLGRITVLDNLFVATPAHGTTVLSI